MKINYLHLCKLGSKGKVCEDFVALPEINEKYEIYDLNFEIKGCLFVLCDGMGGHKAGEIASELSANWLVKDFYRKKIDKPIQAWFKDEIVEINERLFNLANENEQYYGMGTTLVSLLLTPKRAYINNVGDSRLYLFDQRLVQVTEDHSEVWQMYKKGLIKKDDIINNRKKNIITEAIGTNAHVNMNTYAIEVPERFLFLLCSDGLTDVMTDHEIESVIKKSSDLNVMADSLYHLSQEKGSKDDVSIILVSNYLETTKGGGRITLHSFNPEFDDEAVFSSLDEETPGNPEESIQDEENEPVKDRNSLDGLKPKVELANPELKKKHNFTSPKGLVWILLFIIISGMASVTTYLLQKKKIDELAEKYKQAKVDLDELRKLNTEDVSEVGSEDGTLSVMITEVQYSENVGDEIDSSPKEDLSRFVEESHTGASEGLSAVADADSCSNDSDSSGVIHLKPKEDSNGPLPGTDQSEQELNFNEHEDESDTNKTENEENGE